MSLIVVVLGLCGSVSAIPGLMCECEFGFCESVECPPD